MTFLIRHLLVEGPQYTLRPVRARGGFSIRLAAALAAALALLSPARPVAHEIPADVLIQILARPDGAGMKMLVRVPLAAMRDINFPTREPGFLILSEATPAVRTAAALWVAGGISLLENGEPVAAPAMGAVRLSRPSDRSFAAWDEALAHVTGPGLPDDTQLLWDQALLDVELDFPIASASSAFAIDSDLSRLGLRATTSLRVLLPDGRERAFAFVGDPGVVTLDPRWHQTAWRFVTLGFEHILGGTDHLLFLLCLVVPFRRLRELALIVTAFTVAHSITLASAALGFAPDALWFPPLVETLIAASIVYMAIENIVMEGVRGGAAGSEGVRRGAAGWLRRRWVLTCAFGLVHGFGFSFALAETLQFAGSHLVTSLVSFNLGVELGQLLVLVVLVPALGLAFRRLPAERVGIVIVSALVAHTAWHWMVERGASLGEYAWTLDDPLFAADALRWTMRVVAVAGVIWLASTFMRTRTGTTGTTGTAGTR